MRTGSNFFLLLLSILISPVALAFDLEGKVKLEPPFPPPSVLEIPEEHSVSCGTQKLSPKLKISAEGSVANAVVKLEGNLPGPIRPPADEFVLDQTHCEFSPHILLVPKGATVQIKNSEAMLHNVRAFNEKAEMLFNVAMPKKGQVLKKHFDEPGRVIVRCGVHPWMHAIVIVQEHPYYALTDETGSFKIEGIPEGTYRISVWHESLGILERTIEITKNDLDVSLSYGIERERN